MDTLLQIVVIIILTLLEGVFVAAEIALVTMRRSRVDQLVDEGNRSAQPGQGGLSRSPAASSRSPRSA